jgi:hypothetical protein
MIVRRAGARLGDIPRMTSPDRGVAQACATYRDQPRGPG